jgi:signal transduction histidine kinase
MRVFTSRIFTHRRIIIIFLLAIFIPSLVAAYLSLSTFPKRREAVRNLLESNLWIFGESALKSVEESLLDFEQKALRPENFVHLVQVEKDDHPPFNRPEDYEDSVGQLFLLDADFKIVFPESASENSVGIITGQETGNEQFDQSFRRAELFEFSQKDYARAAELYKKCMSYTLSDQDRAVALNGAGRCLMTLKRYDEAEKAYNEISKNFGQYKNKAGHPYGIIASFQLFEIACTKKDGESSSAILLDLYRKIRDGNWLISRPVYDFYASEIESSLNGIFSDGKLPGIQRTFLEIQKQPSLYGQTLLFTDFLERNITPSLKEKLSLSGTEVKSTSERLSGVFQNERFLVSWAAIQDLKPGQIYYSGLKWDLNLLRNHTIPEILKVLSKDSGLDLQIVDEAKQDISSANNRAVSGESLSLAFRQFPLPWKLFASHPEIRTLENSARREIFFYGFLLAVIIVLMLFGAVMIARDISRESETNRLRTEFVNNISHELKTPLTLIRLYGETLQRKDNLTDGEKKECYEIITKESERLSHLINNVLDFSRIEMGRKEFNFKKGFLQEVIKDTLESYRYHLEKKGFTVLSYIADDLPEMDFDGEAVASVLVNLLSNAMKFSPEEKEVTVRLFRDNENAVLRVADKGTGIPKKEIPKIFERFYQAENNTATEAKGSGLGLTLVKHIVEAHGGTIEVDSEVGKGSMFTVRLPMGGT